MIKLKKTILFVVFFLMLCTTVNAESNSAYDDAYNNSGLDGVYESIDDDTEQILENLNIDPKDYSSLFGIKFDSVLGMLKDFFKSGVKMPITVFSLSVCILVAGSVINGMWTQKHLMGESYNYVILLSLCTVVLVPLFKVCTAAVGALKSVSTFMLAFVPVYASILVTAGSVATGTLYGGVMLGVCEGVAQLLSFVVAPVISIYACLGISACVSGVKGAYSLALKIKSAANWIMGLLTTVFTGFLSVQSVVSKAADNLSMKTAKFFCGSFVPVAGNALSDALTTVVAGMGILKSSAAAYCIIVIFAFLIPFIIEILIWRAVLALLSAVSCTLSSGEISKLFEVLNSALGFLIGIILFVAVLFVLSLAAVKVGGVG